LKSRPSLLIYCKLTHVDRDQRVTAREYGGVRRLYSVSQKNDP